MSTREREPAPSSESRGPIARELALRAGAIHRRWFRALKEGDVRFKRARDPVTEADLEAERLIVDEIRRRYPGDSILAEEGSRHEGDSGYEWIVDPLDGTVNFAHGLPLYTVALAVHHGGRPVLSVIYAPHLDEIYTAERGGGASCNGRAIQVSGTAALDQALLTTGFAYERDRHFDDNVAHFADLVMRCRDLRRLGSASLDLAFVAAGRVDGFWEPNLCAWDVAPGALLVEEAGGRCTEYDGGADHVRSGQLLATNGVLHEAVRARLSD